MTHFKAVRTDGRDFYSGTIDYASACAKPRKTIKHPRPGRNGDSQAGRYLSISTVATDCTGFSWPARLFEVEPVGDVWTPHADGLPNKRATAEVRVIRELPAHLLFGPDGDLIVKIIDRFATITSDERTQLRDGYTAAFWTAYSKVAYRGGLASRAGLGAARGALGDRLDGWDGGSAAYGAALALLLRPSIGKGLTQTDYNTLTRPWRKVIGEVHPDDKPIRGGKK